MSGNDLRLRAIEKCSQPIFRPRIRDNHKGGGIADVSDKLLDFGREMPPAIPVFNLLVGDSSIDEHRLKFRVFTVGRSLALAKLFLCGFTLRIGTAGIIQDRLQYVFSITQSFPP